MGNSKVIRYFDPVKGEVIAWKKKLDDLFKLLYIEGKVEKDGKNGKPNIEPIAQKESYDCGPPALGMWLLIIGRGDLIKQDLAARLKTSPEVGTPIVNITGFLKEENVAFIEMLGASLRDLEDLVKNGFTCVVDYQAWGTDEEKEQLLSGHYSVVYDIDDEFVWLFDPSIDDKDPTEDRAFGRGVVRVKRENFDEWWVEKETSGEVYDHWLIAGKRNGY